MVDYISSNENWTIVHVGNFYITKKHDSLKILKDEKTFFGIQEEYAFQFERQCKGYVSFNENMRFSELADWYFENYATIELKPNTAYPYKRQYDKHIKPVFGNMKLK